MDFHTLKRKQLQALCKEHGIPANLKNDEMANKLTLLLKEKAKPLTRKRSCLKNSDEIDSDNDSKDMTRKLKKVRFSPEHEMIEFEDSEEDSDKEIPLPAKRGARRRSAKPVVKKSGLVIGNDADTKFSEGIMDNPVIVTRSRAQNSMEGDPLEKKKATRGSKSGSMVTKNIDGNDANTKLSDGIMDNPVTVTRSREPSSKEGGVFTILSPPFEKKIGRRGPKSGSMVAKKIDESNNQSPVVKLADNVDFRDAHVKEIEGSDNEKALRRSKRQRNVTKMNDPALLDGESGQIEIVRRISRPSTQVEGQQASAIDNAKGTKTATEFEVRGKLEVVLQFEEPPGGFGRKASKRKSVALKNEKVRSDGPLVENEPRKQSRNTLLEGFPEIEVGVELLKKNKKVSPANGPLRRSRRNTNAELGTHENVGSIELSNRLTEPLPVKKASGDEEHLRRSRRNASSRPDYIATSNEMDGIANAAGKNGLWKQRMDPVGEEEASVTECEPLIEDPPRRFTRNASKRQSISFAGLTGKAVEKKQPQNRSTMPILEVEAPLRNSKLVLEEPPIVDAEVTVAGAAKCSNDSVLSYGEEVAKGRKIRRLRSKKKSSSKKLNSYTEVHPVISDVEEIRDLAMVNLEENTAAMSVKLPSVTTNSETETFVVESVATEKESFSMGDDKENLQGDSCQGDEDDQAFWIQSRREDFNDDNPVEPSVDGYSSVQRSYCVDKPAHLMDLVKDLETEEVSTGMHTQPSRIVAEGDKASIPKEQSLEELEEANGSSEQVIQDQDHASECNASGASKFNSENASEGTNEIVAEKVSEIQFTTSGCCTLGMTPLTSILGPKHQASGNGDKVIRSHGHTFNIDNNKQEQEWTQANTQYLVQSTMLGGYNTNIVKGEESSSYETDSPSGKICRDETFVGEGGDGMSCQERTEEAVKLKENEPEEASYMGRSKPAASRETTYVATTVNFDVESVRTDSEDQVSKDHESGGSKENSDNVFKEVVEKSKLEFSNEEIILFFTEGDYNRVDNPLASNTAPETFGIVDKDMPSCENIALKINDEHELEEDQLKVQYSIPFINSNSIKMEESSSHEAEMVDGTMFEGEEALVGNVASGRFCQGKSEEIVGAKEAEHMGAVEIGCASPIISKDITDEGSEGNLDVESIGADHNSYPVLDESPLDGFVAEDKESESSKTNCENDSEEGRRACILKLSVGAENSQVLSEETEYDKYENLEEVSGIHEIVAESHEVPTDTTAVKDTGIEHARIDQFPLVTAPLTPIHAPECQGSPIGYKNTFSCKHSLSIEDDMRGQEGNQLKVSSSDTKPLEIEEVLLHETENWVLDEFIYGDADVVEEKTTATSVKKYLQWELGKEAVNEVMKAGSLPQSTAKEFLDGKDGDSANVKDIFTEVLSQTTFGDCIKVTFDSIGGERLPKEKLIALSSPELVSKKLYVHEKEAVESGSFDAVKDVPSHKSNAVTEDKINDEGMKGECEVEHCDQVINEGNAVCPEFVLGDHNDCHKVDAQVNGSADSNLAEIICQESEVFEEKNVEMMKSTSERAKIVDMLKEEEYGGTLLPVCPLKLGQVVSDYRDEFAKMNVNAPGVSGKTLFTEASEDTSTGVAKEKSIFPAKEITSESKDARDILMDIKNGTIPQVDELMSVDLDDHKEEVFQEMEQSYFISSDKLMPEDDEAAGGKEKVRTTEDKFNFYDKYAGAMAIDDDALPQVTEKDFGNHLKEEKVAQVHDSDCDDHIHENSRVSADKTAIVTMKRMDMLNEVEKVGTLLPSGPVALTQVGFDYGLESAQTNVGAPSATVENVCADGENSEGILDGVAKTRLQPDEVNFGSHYDQKEKVDSELDKSYFIASDSENGEAAGLEIIITMKSNMKSTDNNSDAEREEDVDASSQLTGEDFGDHVVAEEVVDDCHDVILDDNCDNTAASGDEIGIVSMDGKGVFQNIMDGTLVSMQRFNGGSELDARNSAEVKLFADASCLKPEMGSSNATVSLLNVSLSHGEEYEPHVYNKDANNDAEENEMTNKDRGNVPKVIDMPYEDNEVTVEKSTGSEKGNNGFNDANDDSIVEEDARSSQEVATKQLGNHASAVDEAAFVASSDCLTAIFANKPSCGNRGESIAKETEEAYGFSHMFDDMVICAGQSKEFADFENLCSVSSSKPEIDGDCSAVLLVSSPADQENGSAEFKVESCMFSSREINLFLADGEEDDVKESNVDYARVSESNEDTREVEENVIIMQLVAEEQLGKDKHDIENEVVELNGSHVPFSAEPIPEDGVASKEKDEVATTTKECNDSEYKMKEAVEVENSFVPTNLEILTELAEMDGSDHASSEETIAEGDPKDLVENVAMTDWEKCEDMGEAMELTEAISKQGLRMVDQYPACIDSDVGRGVAADTADMLQSELAFAQKEKLDASTEYSNNLYAKQLNSSITKRKNVRTTLIPKTPKKLLNTLDMKENTPSIKTELMGNITAVKSVTKRRALEDLQKN